MQKFTMEKKGALCLPGAEAEEDFHPQDFYKTCFTLGQECWNTYRGVDTNVMSFVFHGVNYHPVPGYIS